MKQQLFHGVNYMLLKKKDKFYIHNIIYTFLRYNIVVKYKLTKMIK